MTPRVMVLSRILATVFCTALILAAPAAAQEGPSRGDVTGVVSATGPDGQPFRIPGALVRLLPEGAQAPAVEAVSDDRGEFAFAGIPPGSYRLEASIQGFGAFTSPLVVDPGVRVSQDVRLALASVHEEVVVTALVDGDLSIATAPPALIEQETMRQVPIASESFQGALPLVPGVVRGADGLLNLKGARESQSGLKVNNASVADPVTGDFAFRLPAEAVRSVQVVTSAYRPEYGQTSGGMTKIETTAGSERWKLQVQNLEPRIRRRNGGIHGIESWTPRLAVGGPVAGPALTVFQSVEYRFTRTLVEGLPELEGDTEVEAVNAFTQFDWTASAADHVSMAVALFPQQQRFLGLNTFNPQTVTPDLHQRGFLWTTTGRRVLGPRSVVEAHVGVTRLDTDVFPSQSGPIMILAPGQNAGSYFNTQARASRRYEGLAAYSVTSGAHLVKIGAGAGRDSYDGVTDSRPAVIVGADGTPAELITFDGPADLDGAKTDVRVFVQDTWSVADRLTADFGVRYDYDTVADAHHVAPRLGLSFVPDADGGTVVRGGIGLFYDKLTLNASTFHQQARRLVTTFAADGTPDTGGRIQRPVIEGRLRNPESVAWNVEVDRALAPRVDIRIGYQQRLGRHEVIVNPESGGDLSVSSSGRARYREFAVTGRYHEGGNQLVVSYVRSAAAGDLNDLGAFYGNVATPVIRDNQFSRLNADAPNRVVAWGEFGLPRDFGIAPLVEVRDGFPLSIVSENLTYVGTRNAAGRFPLFLSIDLQVWKDVRLPFARGLKARVGVKVFNLTNHFNPRDFDGNLASPGFGGFSNGVSRTLRGKFVFDF